MWSSALAKLLTAAWLSRAFIWAVKEHWQLLCLDDMYIIDHLWTSGCFWSGCPILTLQNQASLQVKSYFDLQLCDYVNWELCLLLAAGSWLTLGWMVINYTEKKAGQHSLSTLPLGWLAAVLLISCVLNRHVEWKMLLLMVLPVRACFWCTLIIN